MSESTPDATEPHVTTEALGEEDPGGEPGGEAPEVTTDALGEEDPTPEPHSEPGAFGEF